MKRRNDAQTQGHVGVYWRGGALLSEISYPGYNLKIPLITSVSEIQTTVQTDSITNIPCGTSGGTMIYFDKVEVVNQLETKYVYQTIKNYTVDYDQTWIFDKIHHEINQFCSSHTLQEIYIDLFSTLDESLQEALQTDCDKYAPGIHIIAVRVTKPRIPEQIRRNYEQMEAEKTKLMIETQRQKVVEKNAETERKRATIQAQQEKDVSAIEMSKHLATQKAQQEIATMKNEMHLAEQKSIADAKRYQTKMEAEANRELLTQEYIELRRAMSIANNTKIYFGSDIPSMFLGSNNGGAVSPAA